MLHCGSAVVKLEEKGVWRLEEGDVGIEGNMDEASPYSWRLLFVKRARELLSFVAITYSYIDNRLLLFSCAWPCNDFEIACAGIFSTGERCVLVLVLRLCVAEVHLWWLLRANALSDSSNYCRRFNKFNSLIIIFNWKNVNIFRNFCFLEFYSSFHVGLWY